MLELYVGGASLAEVQRHFHEYSLSSICYTAYHYGWPSLRDEITLDIQSRIKQKVLYSKYQQLDLVSTMIQVAHVEAMNAMQMYLKNPNDRNLPKTLRIKTIRDLQQAIEMMSQVIGQDNSKNISITGNIVTTPGQEPEKQTGSVEGILTEATAKSLLKAMNKKTTDPDVVDAEVVSETKK
jgi:hypothetical protein